MTDDHSKDEDKKQVDQPAPWTPEEMTERQKQQQAGWDSLAKWHREVIQTALKEPTVANLEALKKLQVAEPKFAQSVLKDYGYEDLSGYEKAIPKKETPNTIPPKEEVFKMMEEFEQQKSVQSTKAQIDSQFASLPENIKDAAQNKFNSLIEGRTLTSSQMMELARDAITLANASTGSNFKMSTLTLGSTSLNSSPPTTTNNDIDDFIAERAKTDPLFATIHGKK